MDKRAVSKQIGGFMQSRLRTRPYRIDTLLERERGILRKPSEVISNLVPDVVPLARERYDEAMAADSGPEFRKKTATIDDEETANV